MMLLWTAPPEYNHTPMVCEKYVGTYYIVLYLLTNTVSYVGIQRNLHMRQYNILSPDNELMQIDTSFTKPKLLYTWATHLAPTKTD